MLSSSLKASSLRRWILERGEKLVVWLGWFWIRSVYATSRWHFVGRENLDELLSPEPERPVIVCFWHGRMAMMPCAWQWPLPVVILLSQHRDGRLISRILQRFGIGSVEGSSRRGGAEAFIRLCRLAEGKTVIGITPDGPKGPIHSVAPGIVALAKRSNALIVPTSFAVKRKKHLLTWDGFLFPFPFNRGVFVFGSPLDIRQAYHDDNDAMQAIREALTHTTQVADTWIMENAR